MRYDPVKDILGNIVRGHPRLRRVFYWMLGFAFLREWHVKRELRRLQRLRGIGDLYDAGTGFGWEFFANSNLALALAGEVDYIVRRGQDIVMFGFMFNLKYY